MFFKNIFTDSPKRWECSKLCSLGLWWGSKTPQKAFSWWKIAKFHGPSDAMDGMRHSTFVPLCKLETKKSKVEASISGYSLERRVFWAQAQLSSSIRSKVMKDKLRHIKMKNVPLKKINFYHISLGHFINSMNCNKALEAVACHSSVTL